MVRNYINERFYWDSNENILLYTLPNGSVSVSVGSKEYTDIKEKKSEDYVILKTEGKDCIYCTRIYTAVYQYGI